MAIAKKTLRTCARGHIYYKSSDCPICPLCEAERKPEAGFLSLLGAPARRALESRGISTVEQLSKFSEEEILQFHGIGKSSMPILRNALNKNALSFKK
jgi:predicted RecB family nuclease